MLQHAATAPADVAIRRDNGREILHACRARSKASSMGNLNRKGAGRKRPAKPVRSVFQPFKERNEGSVERILSDLFGEQQAVDAQHGHAVQLRPAGGRLTPHVSLA